MKRKNAMIYAMTAVLLAVAIYFAAEAAGPFFFRLPTETGAETIQVVKRGEKRYVFLPGWADLSELQIQSLTPVRLDGEKVGKTCENLETDRPYEITSPKEGGQLTFLQSENIPTLFLDTASGDMDYVHREKGNKEAGGFRLYRADGSLDAAGSLESIKARGNSTFYSDKKPYSLTLGYEMDLLGMGAAKKWVLLANSLDASNLKNKFAYDFAAEAGLPYSPDSRFVDLYLNGEYAGLYQLTERNELAPNRVEAENGFLVSKEFLDNLLENGNPYFETEAGAYLRVRQNLLGGARMQQIFQQAENAMLAPDGRDPQSGKHFTELIDLDSWAGKYLIEEIFDGIDAGVGSQYFFYDPSIEKLIAGPVWDYDDTMGVGIWLGNDTWLNQVPEIFYTHRSGGSPWFHSLYYNEIFYDHMTRLYRETYAPLLATYLQERIPTYEQLIHQSAWLNRIRWETGDPAEETKRIRWYLTERMDFLTRAWAEDSQYLEVHVDYTYEDFTSSSATFDYAVLPGSFLPALSLPEGHSWYYTGTDTPFDPEKPIWEETAIELRETE